MKRKLIIVIMLTVILSLSMEACASNEWNKNERILRTKVKKENIEKVINLTEYTDFEWDALYQFMPYLDNESINEIIGYEFTGLKKSVNDDESPVIFLKDGKIVCYLYDSPSYKGYGFKLFNFGDGICKKVLAENNPKFKIKIYEKYVLLEYIS